MLPFVSISKIYIGLHQKPFAVDLLQKAFFNISQTIFKSFANTYALKWSRKKQKEIK